MRLIQAMILAAAFMGVAIAIAWLALRKTWPGMTRRHKLLWWILAGCMFLGLVVSRYFDFRPLPE
jgi:hypothetical protein